MSVAESVRLYILFGLLGQTGLYLSGSLLSNLPKIADKVANCIQLTTYTREMLCIELALIIISACGVLSMILFWLLQNVIVEKHLIQGFTH